MDGPGAAAETRACFPVIPSACLKDMLSLPDIPVDYKPVIKTQPALYPSKNPSPEGGDSDGRKEYSMSNPIQILPSGGNPTNRIERRII
jgi:hypothetical protein